MDWEYLRNNGTIDQCDRWAQAATSQLYSQMRSQNFRVIASANQIRWSFGYVGGHVAIQFTLIDGSVFYIDNGWTGGEDGIFFPSDVDGFPYSNPMTGPAF